MADHQDKPQAPPVLGYGRKQPTMSTEMILGVVFGSIPALVILNMLFHFVRWLLFE